MEGFANYCFPVSGVQVGLWLPPLVAFGISFFTSMVGISGAVLLLPFQMSVLHYTTPGVSATNLVFNLIATPSGIWRYAREGRLLLPLVGVITAGTLPGIFLGYLLRVHYLPDPARFKLFAGGVLFYLAWRLLGENKNSGNSRLPAENKPGTSQPGTSVIHSVFTWRHLAFTSQGTGYQVSTPALFFLALVVGTLGGTYGIGGGAIIAPFCVTWFRLPIRLVAGAALAGTLATSCFGVAFYSLMPTGSTASVRPDWLLGILFGLGGAIGMYAGASAQKYFSQNMLQNILGVSLLFLAGFYWLQGFW
ncbi:MAG: sulfite exporter TauE/SafE family protein [Magnetococcus sp. DMHC-1]|nr:sulfite exporter TauE/SafE family protein [Magnetococcales bacterium]